MKTKQLPEGWEEKNVSDFASVITGGTPSTTKKEYWEDGTIPWLPSGKCQNCEIVSAEKFITEEGLRNSSARMMPKETVVIALTGATTGKIGIMKIEASANQSVTGILPSDEHVPKFLFYYLRTIRNDILSKAYGGAQPHISQGFVKNIKIPLPPLSVQKKIVEILEQAEELKRRREEADGLMDDYLKSVFSEMFLEDKSEIKFRGFLDVFNITTGKLDSNAMEENGIYPFFTCSQETFKINDYAFDCKALLLSGNNAAGKYSVKYYDGKFNAYQRTYVLTLKEAENNFRYLHFVLKNKLEELRHASIGTNTKYLTLRILKSVKMPMLSPVLQKRFASIVEKVEKIKGAQKKSKQEIDDLFGVLMQKTFRGEIV
jgi:type I restriction enzyme, S subunit